MSPIGVGMGIEYLVCDVFTDHALQGNQLAVFPDARGLDAEQMQTLARELNYSGSTFVFPARAGGHAFVRIFTPVRELAFAGHPCLGTALVLAERSGLAEVVLETGSGLVPVRFSPDQGRPGFGWMTQPVPTVESFPAASELLSGLGIERSELPVELYDNGARQVFIAVASKEQVAELRPDLPRLALMGRMGINCFAGAGSSWKSRMFGPGMGIPEAPATGSAAGPLALHLVRYGRVSWGQEIEISQGEEIGRPSRLYAVVEGRGKEAASVRVGGSALVVARGEFLL